MKVAIIEDDQEIAEVVSIAFEMAWPGSQVVGALNAVEGIDMLRTENPDVVILDIGLPEGDASGFDVCKEFRSFSNVPVIMVTARDREIDIVRGLELGATDYMTKPFSAVELLARIRAIMRRVKVGSLDSQSQPYVSQELSVDFDERLVLANGEPVKLTPTEYKLLCYLIRNPRQVLTNEAIVDEVWGSDYSNSVGLVKAHIQRLRKKLKDSTQNPRLIITERGRGYRFVGTN